MKVQPPGATSRGGFNGLAAQVGQLVILAQNQLLAVEQHGSAAHLSVAGQRVDLGLFGQFHGGGFCPGVVNHQVCGTIGAILAGMGIDMGTLRGFLAGVIDGMAHQPVPQQDREIAGAGTGSVPSIWASV